MATLRSLNFLPSVFRTETNRKFLGSTLDQLISDPQLQKVSAYVGRTFAPSWQTGDSYIQEPTVTRQDYQLEPSLILTDETTGLIDSVITYPDLINKLAYYNAPVNNHSRLFENEYYNFDGLIDPDKFINFYQYYWLPDGPDSVQVSAINVPLADSFQISASTVLDGIEIDKYGDQYNPTITLVQGGTYTFTTDSSVPEFWIQTQPGLTGFSTALVTVPTRDILGVTNNGVSSGGTISFTVPQTNAQNNFVNMPISATVNIASNFTYAQLADQPLSSIIAQGGIDGLQYLVNKKIIFTTQSNAAVDWTSSQTQAVVPQNQRFGIWAITIDGSNYVRLSFVSAIPVLNKVNILEGDTYANRYFYRAPNFAQTLELVPVITANLSTLYYQSSTDVNQYGVINIVATQSDAIINVTNEILGKSSYTSPNGVQFSNGLKVTFDANVLPVSYQYSTCYVEGVGDDIVLIPVQNFVAPEVGVANPDYITMNRASECLNAWTRSNRWFHIDVINSTANYNNTSPLVDQTARAIRPILDFDPNVQLFNSNSTFLATVDLIDFTLTDAFSSVNGSLGYYLDGVQVTAGMKILFAADNDALVSNTVYEVDFINIHQTGEPQINLTAYATAIEGSGVTVLSGNNYAGVSFYFNGISWVRSQQKISINQPIKFDVFDDNGTSFGNTSVYPGTTFNGTNIFGYEVGSGAADSVLNFPLVYQVFNNIGDILFTDYYDTDTFSYLLDSVTTEISVNTGFIHEVDTSSTSGYDIRNLWVTANEDSKQYQHYTFTYSSTNTANVFSVDVQAAPDTLIKNFMVYLNNQLLDPRIYTLTDIDTVTYTGTNITINTSLAVNDKIDVFVYSNIGSITNGYYEIPSNLENNAQNALLTSFTLGQYRSHISNQFEYCNLAIGQFPGYPMSQLEPSVIDTADTTLIDASNSDITADNVSPYTQATSLSSIYAGLSANQTETLFADSTEFDADNTYITADEYFLANYVTGGVGVVTQNLRDIPTISEFPGTIIQNSSGLHYAELFLTDDNYNFVNAIRQARQDYSTFKIKFLQAATVVPNVDLMPAMTAVDAIISYLNANKDSSFPYYYSDMVPYGTNNLSSVSYTVSNPSQLQYNTQTLFNDTVPSNIAILVYLNGSQLIKGIDYTFSSSVPTFTFTNNIVLNAGDTIQLNYYSNTDGSWIPETPTKMGMYPKYTPQIINDTTYENAVQMIVGHDGSNTPIFGDFRDALLLELELRIFNNIKVDYNTTKIDFNTIIPGKFRTTDYTLSEVNGILGTEFLTWATNNKVDYVDNLWFNSADFNTWNYSNFNDKDGDALLGYWRGIYRYFYDTDHPDSRPWEMLGFTQMPSYWETVYGPAPYTSGNLVLWQDLANGYVAGGTTQGTYPEYARPELLEYIPVDDFGNLLPPVQTVTGNYDPNLADENFVFGDGAPAENSWRYSSEYPYAIQIMMALLKPARYFGLFIDSNYQKNLGLNQFIFNSNNLRFQQTDIEINGTTATNSTTIQRVASYTNWIADYVRSFGVNPQTTLVTDVEQMSIQLAYKMASFSDQSYITPILEQSSPGASSTGILVPVDNYSIPLIKSTPLTIATYSAVIVEITGSGYSVRGYDNNNPYFNIIPSNPSNNFSTITQTGVSATIYQDYTSTVMSIPYGNTFTTRQQVVDFLISYQRYLNAVGFVFQQVSSSLNQQQNWILSANEFLVWSQQGWSNGCALVLSPAATQLQILYTDAVVDTIQNIAAGSRALDTNFKVIDSTRYTVLRDSNRGLTTTGTNQPNLFQFNTVDGTTIALLSVNLVQWEHAIVFDNITTFNDIIYQPSTDQRQYRIKLNGYKTGGWNGAINPPGFFINQDNVQFWEPSSTYNINDLVQYKGVYYVAKQQVFPAPAFNYNYWQQIDYTSIKTGLIPNFANTATQYQNFYNVDYVDFNEETDEFAKHLIGFQQRDYLTELDVESSSQLKFYQGFIAQKGTIDSINAFTKAQFNELSSNINLYEEWAFRVGSYGATNTGTVVEVQLNNSTFTGNPQIIEFSPTVYGTNLGTVATLPSNEISIPILTVTPNELYKIPSGWDSNPFITGPEIAISQQIQTAGYVRLNDIDASIFDITNIDSISDIIPNIGSGYHIWTANDFNNTWNVFRVTETNLQVTTISNALDGLIQLSFNGYHSLVVGEIIAIKNFSSTFDGFYQVNLVIDLENILVSYTSNANNLNGFVQVTGDGLLFNLSSVRFNKASDVANFTPLNGWLNNDLVWIDNYESANNWSVLLKQEEYTYDADLLRPASYTNARFGTSIAVATNGLYVLAGSPGGSISYTTGSLALYLKNPSHQFVSQGDIGILSTGILGLGTAIVTMPNGFAVSAPNSNSNLGYVYVGTAATVESSSVSYNQVFVSPSNAPNSYFGQSLAVSLDGYSLYVGAPGINTVYYYSLVTGVTPIDDTINVDTISMEYTLSFTPQSPQSVYVTDVNDNVYVNNIDFTVSGNIITFVNSPQNDLIIVQNDSYYQYVSTITATDSATNDNFGLDIATNDDGSKVYISAPHNSGVQGILGSGAVYVFYRVQQTQVANGSSTVYPATLNIASNASVIVDGIIQNPTQVITNATNNTIDFSSIPAAGSILTIDYGTFQQIQKLGDNISQTVTAFGTSIDYDYISGNLVVGSPNETINNVYYTGSVYRFVDTESIVGQISTTNGNPAPVNGDILSINDYFITVSGITLASLVKSINAASIPGVTATMANSIMTITSTGAASYSKLKVIPIKGTTYSTLGFTPYTMYQKIGNPIPRTLSNFGIQVNLSTGGQNLFVGNPLSTTYESTTFDANTTSFDNYTTEFVDGITNSGSVFVFDLLPGITNTTSVASIDLGNYVEVQQLVSTNINTGDNFGASIAIYENSVFVGSPMAYDRDATAGIVQQFTNSTGETGWTVYRFKPEVIAQNPINKLFIYDSIQDTIITEIECIDPIYGAIPGEARQNIDFLTSYDPASYEFIGTTVGTVKNTSALWGDKQVGMTWWDLSTVRYIEYHQGEEEYRAANWASIMAGSSVDVYEWVESIYPPSQYALYVGDGTPKFADDSTYNQKITFDSVTGSSITTYYYWVVNKTSINVTSPKTLPVYLIAQLIANPLGQGLIYAAILDTDSIALYNLVGDIDGTNTILHIDYATSTNIIDSNIHNQYALVAEGSPTAVVPVNIINKLIDSLSAVDKLGNVVPDPTLLVSERYGINIRPRQSMVVDNLSAMESFVEYVNEICAENQVALSKNLSALELSDPIPPMVSQTSTVNYNQTVPDYTTLTYLDTINLPVGYIVLVESDTNFNGIWVIYVLSDLKEWVTTSMQSYNTSDYWEYTTWYSPNYVEGILPTYTVATKYELQTLQNLNINDIVQVNDNGTGNFEIVQYIGDSSTDNAVTNEFTLLALENGTIQLDTSLYNYVDNGFGFDNERFDIQPYDEYPVQETRNIITGVLNDIFIDDLSSYFNDLFFVLINYILSEQKYVDWVFKTSFISIIQQIRELSQVPLYQPDNQTYLEDYINEVKPYHTNIRQFILNYSYQELYNGDVTDFDLPSYYDSLLGYFRSPDGSETTDALLLETAPQYKDWYNNYQSQQLLSIEVTDGGADYVTVPKIIISGGGGLGATAVANINDSGQITSIDIVYGGTNFTSRPTVYIEGGGGYGATAVAIIGNDLIRNINTTIKFDRITFGTSVVAWAPNTAFTTTDIVSYNNVGYSVSEDFTSGSTFGTTYLTAIEDADYTNANDRIMVLYQPVSGMPGLDLGQLQSGIEYPGVIIDGLRFEQTPLFDLPAFDIYPFDSTVIGPEGFPEPEDIIYDASISSLYTDTYLGLRPEDINFDGGPYMGGFNSYAPEELITVSNYDTLDMKVLTLDPTYSPTADKGIPIDSLVYSTNGTIKTFSYTVGNSLGDNILVYTRNTGAKTINVDYTVNYVAQTITFTKYPAAGDDVIIYVIDDGGANQIYSGAFVMNGTTNEIFIAAPFESIQDSLVLYNGLVTASYTLSLAPDNRNTIFTINMSKTANLSVHIHLYSKPLVATDVDIQTITMPSTISSGNYTINLEKTVYDTGPWGGQVIVEQNDSRLIPTNTVYYTGDGVTTVYASQSTVPLNPANVTTTDFDVWLNGTPCVLNTQYTVLPAGTGPVEIQFIEVPPAGSLISVGLNTQAQYKFVTNSQIQLNQSLVTLKPGDIIRISTFANQDTLDIRTIVYEGGQVTQSQELLGFSEDLFDSIGFDSTTTIELIEPLYILSRPAYNMNYLYVTYNGRRLYPNFDFTMQTPTTLLISNSIAVQPTDTVIITSFTETIQQDPLGFRMFKDMNDNWSYLRLSAANTTTLAQPLHITDTQIYVVDAAVLTVPNTATSTPGVIFVGGERITYWTLNTTTNVLGQIRRGTLGTSATQAIIPAGMLVEDAGVDQEIPFASGVTWYNLGTGAPSNGESLIVANTPQANFLREEPSFYFS